MASYLDTADPALTDNSPAFDQLLHSFNTVHTHTHTQKHFFIRDINKCNSFVQATVNTALCFAHKN